MTKKCKEINEYYSIFVDPANLDYRVKKDAKVQYGISDEILDEDFDLDSIGIQDNSKVDMSQIQFSATYPENGNNTVNQDNVIIAWTEAPLVDTYTYVVAEDPELTKVVATDYTINTNAKITGLEKGKTYYWTVTAHNESREYGCDIPVQSGVMSFTTKAEIIVDTSALELAISNVEALVETITEGTNPGEYKVGTVQSLTEKIEKGKNYLNNVDKVESQSEIDELVYDLNRFLNNSDAYGCLLLPCEGGDI